MFPDVAVHAVVIPGMSAAALTKPTARADLVARPGMTEVI
jgi:hypothetical protein